MNQFVVARWGGAATAHRAAQPRPIPSQIRYSPGTNLHSHSHGTLESAAREQMFEEIAFVRLVPVDLTSGYGADV
jgi:hypothetical protein